MGKCSPTVSVDLPQEIADGLECGVYERLGGAIREVDTGQIIAFLREAYGLGEPIVSELLSLSATPANANAPETSRSPSCNSPS